MDGLGYGGLLAGRLVLCVAVLVRRRRRAARGGNVGVVRGVGVVGVSVCTLQREVGCVVRGCAAREWWWLRWLGGGRCGRCVCVAGVCAAVAG